MPHALERAGTWIKIHWLQSLDEKTISILRGVYERFLDVVTLGRGVPRSINGKDIVRVCVNHRYVDEVYEPEVFELLSRELLEGDVVFDVGAYIGLYSIVLARKLGHHGRVYAFEPAPESLRLLRRHLEMNDVTEKVEVIPFGVGDRCETKMLFANNDHIQNSFSDFEGEFVSEADPVEVQMVSLDEFCKKESTLPAWVKIDTEGWELPVLRGSVNTIAHNRNVRFVVEMHPYAWESAGYDGVAFKEFCAQLDLSVLPLSGQSDVYAEYGQVLIRVNG